MNEEKQIPELKILVWAINESRSKMEELCSVLLLSAKALEIEVELFGIGIKHTEHKARIWLLLDYLKDIDPETIIVCMDGADTLFVDSKERLMEQFLALKTRILISAEKDYTYQFFSFEEKFNTIPSPYRYVNAGTFMGYAGDLKQMLEEIILLNEKLPQANDQGLLGAWAYLYLDFPDLVQLDIHTKVFWVTTSDWSALEELTAQNKALINPTTNEKAVIIHCIGAQGRKNELYLATLRSVLKENPPEQSILKIGLPWGRTMTFNKPLPELPEILWQEEKIELEQQVFIYKGKKFDPKKSIPDTTNHLDLGILLGSNYLVCDQKLEEIVIQLGYIPIIPSTSLVANRAFNPKAMQPRIPYDIAHFYDGKEEEEKKIRSAIKPFFEAFEKGKEQRQQEINILLDQIENRVPVICTFNLPFISLFKNFLASCERNHIKVKTKILFFPMDHASYEACLENGVLFYYQEGAYGPMPSDYHGYAQRGYRNCMFMKNAIVKDLLDIGSNLLFMDIDMIWQKYPVPYLSKMARLGNYDFLFMYDGPNPRDFPLNYNSGFFYVKNTAFSKKVWDIIYQNFDKTWYYYSQQIIVNKVISHFEAQGLRTKALDKLKFVNGHMLVPRFQEFEKVPSDSFVVHISWTGGMDHKLKMYKQFDLWFLPGDK